MENKYSVFYKTKILGILLLLISILLLFVLPNKAPEMVEGFFTPIIAFEFARTSFEVKQIFGEFGTDIYDKMISLMKLGNQLDFIFLIIYSFFLFSFVFTIYKITKSKFFLIPLVLSIVILFADFFENIQLLSIIDKLQSENINEELYYLNIFTWLKWGGIALYFLLLYPFLNKGNLYSKITGTIGIVTFLTGVMAFVQRSILNEIFAILVSLMFLLIFFFTFIYKEREF